jgi:hypothetical protein
MHISEIGIEEPLLDKPRQGNSFERPLRLGRKSGLFRHQKACLSDHCHLCPEAQEEARLLGRSRLWRRRVPASINRLGNVLEQALVGCEILVGLLVEQVGLVNH